MTVIADESVLAARAHSLARRGWPIFPCEVGNKKPLGRLVPHGLLQATTDRAQIEAWWTAEPRANIGIATGDPSGFFVVDVDTKHGGPASWAQLTTVHGGEPQTATVTTPSGGWHLYFSMPPGAVIRNSSGELGPGIDVRGTGGYVVGPGSVRADGAYTWQSSMVADPPHWLIELITKKPKATSAHDRRDGDDVVREGRRNSHLASLAGSMRRRGMTPEAMLAALLKENARRCDPPLSEGEIEQIATSIGKYSPDGAPANSFEEDIERAIAKERTRREARRRLDAEERGPITLPIVETLRSRLSRPRPAIEYRIEQWQPRNTRVMLAAQFKGGKTTLIGNLARSLVDGEAFLGRDAVHVIDGSLILVDVEMGESQLETWLATQGIRNDDQIIPFSLRGQVASFNILDPQTRTAWAQLFREQRGRYLVLDCARPVMDAIGLDEQREAGRFLVAFDALLAEAEIPEALIVHHMGHAGERARGDSRLRDWPDVEWRLMRQDDDPASIRYITAYGRDVDIGERQLAYDAGTRHLTIAGGSRQDSKALEALEDIAAVLEEPMSGRSIKAKLKESEHSRMDVENGLRLGIKNGQLLAFDGPKRARLYRRNHHE